MRWLTAIFSGLMIFFCGRSFALEYLTQNRLSKMDHSRFQVIQLQMEKMGFLSINPDASRIMSGFNVHQYFLNRRSSEELAMVILSSQQSMQQFSDVIRIEDARIFHRKINGLRIAIWTRGFSDERLKIFLNQLTKDCKKSAHSARTRTMGLFVSEANANFCDEFDWQQTEQFAEIQQQSATAGSFSCWGKIKEGLSAKKDEVTSEISAVSKINAESLWTSFKRQITVAADFVSEFYDSPKAWLKKHIPNVSLDFSWIDQINSDQLLSLSCLTLGMEGPSALANTFVKGPVGIALKLFEIFKKLSNIGKVVNLLSKLKNLSVEALKKMKEKVMNLAEKILKKQEGTDKADSLERLLTISPELGAMGMKCI